MCPLTGRHPAIAFIGKMLDARCLLERSGNPASSGIPAVKMADFPILSSIQKPVSSIGCYIGINFDHEIIDNKLSI